ncbi:OmpA family protein [Variovorax dokdonensis]|uniref:OmpA family protein n=1 Tax=Variovorax dokdonensis TaxID=344883 RepID=A0ABT7N8A1_9BURK|nr:OmpA family protein [Variovorax dokdonensis]MDM0044151.1 OmpA family protein [Variovorax dokdonensis]
MNGNTIFKSLAGGIVAGGLLLLPGCGHLGNEHHQGCNGQTCELAAVAATAPAPQPSTPRDTLTLNADGLFAFDRSGLGDLLPAGKAELDRMATAIRTRAMNVRALTIIGHTDRLGDSAYNDRLSLQRATTVRTYLKSVGVDVPMQVSGMGEREPVSGGKCIGKRRGASLIACLQPDRRVVIEIEGWPSN